MVARYMGIVNMHGFQFTFHTARKSRDGKTSHLFPKIIDGAISGSILPYCEHDRYVRFSIAGEISAWSDSPDLKLCNNCARAWRKAKRREKNRLWVGEP